MDRWLCVALLCGVLLGGGRGATPSHSSVHGHMAADGRSKAARAAGAPLRNTSRVIASARPPAWPRTAVVASKLGAWAAAANATLLAASPALLEVGVKPSPQEEFAVWAKMKAMFLHRHMGSSVSMPGCHKSFAVKSSRTRSVACPEECPYTGPIDFAQLHACHFKCVRSFECGSGLLDPQAVIPDGRLNVCRRCVVAGCHRCASERLDRCSEDGCSFGYYYQEGLCIGRFVWLVKLIFAKWGIHLSIIALWWIDLEFWRRRSNRVSLVRGLGFRETLKLRTLQDGALEAFSLLTGLFLETNSDVAGPGLVLYFQFLLISVLWPIVIVIMLLIFSFVAGHVGFLNLGKEPDVTAVQLCSAMIHESGLRMRYDEHQASFLLATYILSTLVALCYAMSSMSGYSRMRAKVTTMSAYTLKVEGLSKRSGTDEAEVLAKRFLEKSLDMELVGVSLCWAYGHEEVDVKEVIEADLHAVERKQAEDAGFPAPRLPRDDVVDETACDLHRALSRWEAGAIKDLCGVPAQNSWDDPEEVAALLDDFRTSGEGYAVFRTEVERDEAYRRCKEAGGYQERNCTGRVVLKRSQEEPYAVLWKNFTSGPARRARKIVVVVFTVVLAQVGAACFLYAPFAHYITAFAYAHGQTPNMSAACLFSLLVLVVNELNRSICGYCSKRVGFLNTTTHRSFYIVISAIAGFFNMIAAVGVTALLAFRAMSNLGMKSKDGVPFAEMTNLHDILETFPMQKIFAEQLWLYTFSSAVLRPFIVEPVLLIVSPVNLFIQRVVPSCPSIVGRHAEVALTCLTTQFDAGRYVDTLTNIGLCVCAMFLAQGFWLRALLSCAASNLWIMMLDQYRVLRELPRFTMATNKVDAVAQDVFAAICAGILSAWLLKVNCRSEAMSNIMCVRDYTLVLIIVGAAALHISVHFLLTRQVFPRCFAPVAEPSAVPYAEACKRIPGNPFNLNPVFCLRSKHVYKHDPPCMYFTSGKERLLQANPSIGCYFQLTKNGESRRYLADELPLTEELPNEDSLVSLPLADELPLTSSQVVAGEH